MSLGRECLHSPECSRGEASDDKNYLIRYDAGGECQFRGFRRNETDPDIPLEVAEAERARSVEEVGTFRQPRCTTAHTTYERSVATWILERCDSKKGVRSNWHRLIDTREQS